MERLRNKKSDKSKRTYEKFGKYTSKHIRMQEAIKEKSEKKEKTKKK